MKIFHSPTSPFVRKVLVAAAETGVAVEIVASGTTPMNRDMVLAAENPLAQVPTLVADNGTALWDSRVICDYLDSIGHTRIIPANGSERWRSLVEQSTADGLLNAALLMRYEQVIRPETHFYEPWFEAQFNKVQAALDRFEEWAATFADRVDVGTIAVACALGYLDLRFADRPWRDRAALAGWFEGFSQRPSMQKTRHPG